MINQPFYRSTDESRDSCLLASLLPGSQVATRKSQLASEVSGHFAVPEQAQFDLVAETLGAILAQRASFGLAGHNS